MKERNDDRPTPDLRAALARGVMRPGIDEDVHSGGQRGHKPHHADVPVSVIFIGFPKTLAFMLGPHKGFDQPHTRDILLKDRVESVQFLLNGHEQRPHARDEKEDDAHRSQ